MKSGMPIQKKRRAVDDSGVCAVAQMSLPPKSYRIFLAFLLLNPACSGPLEEQQEVRAFPNSVPQQNNPGASLPSVPARRLDFHMDDSRPFALRAQGIIVRLPDADGWKAMPSRGGWTGLSHVETKSEIWLRHSPARRTVRLSECEEQSRQSLTLLRHGEAPAHERRLTAPSGYGGVVHVILPPGGGGLVEAFGVGVSRCLAVVFITGDAPGFPERLQVATNEILDSLALPSFEERGGAREPLPF